ncbi:MAG: hypothetical protein Q4F40_09545, partial [Akkermansia sp.]|nr:hypothetical protein [Akkermansia sp.]
RGSARTFTAVRISRRSYHPSKEPISHRLLLFLPPILSSFAPAAKPPFITYHPISCRTHLNELFLIDAGISLLYFLASFNNILPNFLQFIYYQQSTARLLSLILLYYKASFIIIGYF